MNNLRRKDYSFLHINFAILPWFDNRYFFVYQEKRIILHLKNILFYILNVIRRELLEVVLSRFTNFFLYFSRRKYIIFRNVLGGYKKVLDFTMVY